MWPHHTQAQSKWRDDLPCATVRLQSLTRPSFARIIDAWCQFIPDLNQLGLCWDDRQGLYEASLDFWFSDYAPAMRASLCRKMINRLDSPAALVAMEQVAGLLRQHLALLQSPVNTLSFAMSTRPDRPVDSVKFYFELFRYQEYRDQGHIRSQSPAPTDLIMGAVMAASQALGIVPPTSECHALLGDRMNLRPTLLATSFDPIDITQSKMTVYYALEDWPLDHRDRMIRTLAQMINRPQLALDHAIVHDTGALPICIAAYGDPGGAIDLKIDYRYPPAAGKPGVIRALRQLSAVQGQELPDILDQPICLGLHARNHGQMRLKLYYC